MRVTALKEWIILEGERMAEVYEKLFVLWIETLSVMYKNRKLFPTCKNSVGFFKWTLEVSILTLLLRELCMCRFPKWNSLFPKQSFLKPQETNRIQSSYVWYTPDCALFHKTHHLAFMFLYILYFATKDVFLQI